MNHRQSRRAFLGIVGLGALAVPRVFSAGTESQVMTVRGPIAPDALGRTLAHEHAVVDFIGAEKAAAPRYDADEAFTTILPHLERLKGHGCRTLVECTPNYIGRNVRLLQRLSEASGLHLLTNTGYYGAAGNKFLPQHAFACTVDDLRSRWLKEWQEGIDGTGIRPGFIKLGVEKGKLSELHAKLVRAAAGVHLESGLTIAIHTGNGEAALDELRLLGEAGVAPAALIWVHAQNDPGPVQIEAARRGAWVSLDGYSPKHHQRYLDWLTVHRKEKLLGRILLSHDHFWSVQGEAAKGSLKLSAGGETRPFEGIFTRLLPALRETGFTEADIHQLLVLNPREAFTIRVRQV